MLTFNNVTKVYEGGNKAVDQLDLEVRKGEFIVFIGPSGCGKTTTMKMINRLIEPTTGTISIEGQNILEMNPVEVRRSIGYVIQQIGLFPHMTILENITLVPKLLKWPEEEKHKRAEELLQLVNMDPDEFLDRYPHELSGGQQQRIGVLRALAANPPLILMDEPFGALDPITRDNLQEEFKNLQQTLGKTIVFVTHDMDEALKLADRIVIMRDGKVVQIGTPDEILNEPADEFVEQFIGKERLLQARPNLKTVEQIMNDKPVTIPNNRFLTEAIGLMKDRRVNTLLVIDENKKLAGYVDVEAIDRNRKKYNRVKEVLQEDLYVVKKGTLIRDTINNLLKKGLDYAVVVDEYNHLLGIVTRSSIVDMVYDSIWGEVSDDDAEAS